MLIIIAILCLILICLIYDVDMSIIVVGIMGVVAYSFMRICFQSHKRINPIIHTRCDDLIKYLENYNPLIDYYSSIPLTNEDRRLIHKISNKTQDIIQYNKLSGIMLLKIYFRREQFINILTPIDYTELMQSAKNTYDIFSNGFENLFIPDMYGYRDVNVIDLSSLNNEIIELNELFYFNHCS